MKKYKLLLLAFLILFVFWVCFTAVDCIRLRVAETDTKPLITLSENITQTRTTYTGLGYTVSYYTDTFAAQSGCILWEEWGYGAEFRLFGVLIWAWIE